MTTGSNLKNKSNTLLLFTLLLLLWGSCINEDLSECETGHYICFDLRNPKYKFPEVVNTVDLYFYNQQNGNLAADYHYKKDQLREHDYAAYVPDMPSGQYNVVAIINNIECYKTFGIEEYNKLSTSLEGEIIEKKPIDIFSAQKEITIKRISSIVSTDTMNLTKHTNNIHVNIRFEKYTPSSGNTVDTYIAGGNGVFNYSTYSCDKSSYRKYIAHQTAGSVLDEIPAEYDFTTMRLWRKSDMTLYIEEKGLTRNSQAIIEMDIEEELAKVKNENGEPLYDTDEKLEFHDDYEITITIGPSFVVVGLEINDWVIKDSNVEV